MVRVLVDRFQKALGSTLLSAMGGVVATIAATVTATVAQTPLPNCAPPEAGEFLLLVVSQTPEAQAQVRRNLPPNVNPTICNYVDRTVTRIEGFTNLEVANSWARYMTEIAGLPAFVAKPADSVAVVPSPRPSPVAGPRVQPPVIASPSPRPSPVASPSPVVSPASPQPQPTAVASPQPVAPASPRPQPTPPPQNLAFNPQPLGRGYAVIVDYLNQPEVAAQVRQVIGRDVGLVSYNQRPYLLANFTPNEGMATATLKALSDNGLLGLIVDSRRVILLRRSVTP